MSQDNYPANKTSEKGEIDTPSRNIVTPDVRETETTTIADSPVEKAKDFLSDELHRDFIAAGDDHPLVQTAGSKEALSSSTNVALIRELSDGIYAGTDAFWREWKQNHIAAVVREAKRRIKNELGPEHLWHEFEHDHPALDTPNTIRLPKTAYEILTLAIEELGYAPIIEYHVFHDENRLRTRDNGIAMTTGEVIDVWNEPAISGSGVDLSSAGAKGLGALTSHTIHGEQGVTIAKTRTLREKTLMTEEPVPQRDQDGFKFLSYMGGVLPIAGGIEDGFYGTEFDIPVKAGLSTHAFKENLREYCDILPATVTWYETEDGVTENDEFERVDFFGRYDQQPSIQIERPGEFRVALDNPDIVPKNRGNPDTFLLDNPIDRNTSYSQGIDTLWNEHIQLLNEQGLIIDGPNRGKLRGQVDDLAGELGDIKDDDAAMPDIPLPEPTTSRDQLKNDEALDRFIEYVDQICRDEELKRVDGYINGFLDTDTPEEAAAYVREKGSEYDLFKKLLKKHASYKTYRDVPKLMSWMDGRDSINFSFDDCEQQVTVTYRKQPNNRGNTREYDTTNHRSNIKERGDGIGGDDATVIDCRSADAVDNTTHPKYRVIKTITALSESVDVATASTRGDPNKKDNRKSKDITLGDVVGRMQKHPIYVGAKLNEDRCRVLFDDENHPDAAVLKVKSYSQWTSDHGKFNPYCHGLIKHVPFSEDDQEKDRFYDGFHVPDAVNERHKKRSSQVLTTEDGEKIDFSKGVPEEFDKRRIDIRHTSNSAIDTRTTMGKVRDDLYNADFGDPIRWTDKPSGEPAKPWVVLFPSTRDEKISDHYELSEVTNIIKCKGIEAEVLEDYSSVFYPDEFKRMLEDTRFEYESPFNRQTYEKSIKELLDSDRKLVLDSGDGLLRDLLDGTTNYSDEWPDKDEHPGQYEDARSAVAEKYFGDLSVRNPLIPEQERDSDKSSWYIVDWDVSRARKRRVFAYLRAYHDSSKWIGDRVSRSDMHHLGKATVDWLYSFGSTYTRQIRRGRYSDAWDVDSGAWTRVNKTGFRAPSDYEKELLKVCRDNGIDPAASYFKQNPESLRRALNELIDRCPKEDQ